MQLILNSLLFVTNYIIIATEQQKTLKDLFMHDEVLDFYSAEKQIIEALPKMIRLLIRTSKPRSKDIRLLPKNKNPEWKAFVKSFPHLQQKK
jgi:hypothetical protein